MILTLLDSAARAANASCGMAIVIELKPTDACQFGRAVKMDCDFFQNGRVYSVYFG